MTTRKLGVTTEFEKMSFIILSYFLNFPVRLYIIVHLTVKIQYLIDKKL